MLNISAHGSREGVKKAIQAYKVPETKDEARFKELNVFADSVRKFLLSEVDALPTEANGCRVDASGDVHTNVRTLQVNVLPLKLHI